MAIINLANELAIWAKRWCAARGYTYLVSGLQAHTGNYGRIYNYNMSVPDPIVTDNPTNAAMARGTTPNPTSQPIIRTISFNETLTDSQSTATEHGITAGAEVTVKSEAGLIFAKVGFEVKVSFQYNYTTTNTYTTETSRSWTDSLQITVPPGYVTEHTFIVQTGPYSKNVVLEADIAGHGWFNYSAPGYTGTGIVNITQVLYDNKVPGVTPYPDNFYARFRGSGKLEGKMGLQSFVNLVERPLLGRAGQVREYQIPVSLPSGLDIPIFDPVVSLQ
uniref:Parasporin 1470D n=2 Tax=Bacillus thuringiensis TaxID=1428 RepID=Q6L5X8_BACTU|nr:parasporin 1470D [Bacillus thuringiensis serovar shandongiensis]